MFDMRFDGRLIWKSPVKIGHDHGIPPQAGSDDNEASNREPCTCELCRRRNIHNKTTPAPAMELHI
jgi:hypothetical protein